MADTDKDITVFIIGVLIAISVLISGCSVPLDREKKGETSFNVMGPRAVIKQRF